MRAATLHRLAGDLKRAAALLDELRAEIPSGVERADVLFELALTRRVDSGSMIGLCDQALAEARGDDVRSARILAYRSFAHMFAGDVPRALVDGRAALEIAERVDDSTLIAVAIARIGQAETYAADVTPGLLERGAEIEARLGLALEYYESPSVALARHEMRLGQIERAQSRLDALITAAATRGDEGSHTQLMWSLSIVDWLAGRWEIALDHVVEACELAAQTQETSGRGMVGRVKALIEADLGLVDKARASAEEGLAAARARSDEYFAISSLAVLGRLELALGNLDAAGGYLRELPPRLVSLGINDPGAPVWADAVETLIALGEVEPARSYLDHFEAHARRSRNPLATAAATRCRGLLAAKEGDLTGAEAALEQAVAELGGTGFPFERGRILLALGMVRRQVQQKGPARAALEEAQAVFEGLGARLWAVKASDELTRISGRRPATAHLTATEHEVAALAANGRSNKEIAADLFMGVSTVEAHLSAVYRKLGMRRAELGTWLSAQGDAANPVEPAPQT
jgi:DNA-binding CsgD family transcriptional regulator